MNSFKTKKIGKTHSLANRLKQARLEKSLSLADVKKETNIQIKHLEILEKGDYEKLPGNIYVRSWLKIYGKLLELPVSELLEDYKIQSIINKKIEKIKNEKNKNKLYYNLLSPKNIKIGTVFLVVLILFSYLALEVKKIVSPPYIKIIEPNNNYITNESTISIFGKTIPEVELMINNEKVLLDKKGNFKKDINLMLGLNNLEINAKKKYSKIKKIELNILRKE
tara:strand:- start:387 stop:1055 length:669 start_codon:yes stop_codon:yes gene_type:complete